MAVFNFHLDYKRLPPGHVSIMRPGPWGNPYVIGKDGTREEVLEKFRHYLWSRVKTEPGLLHSLAGLHGKALVCCCKPAACHGDILEVAAAWADKKVRGLKPRDNPLETERPA